MKTENSRNPSGKFNLLRPEFCLSRFQLRRVLFLDRSLLDGFDALRHFLSDGSDR